MFACTVTLDIQKYQPRCCSKHPMAMKLIEWCTWTRHLGSDGHFFSSPFSLPPLFGIHVGFVKFDCVLSSLYLFHFWLSIIWFLFVLILMFFKVFFFTIPSLSILFHSIFLFNFILILLIVFQFYNLTLGYWPLTWWFVLLFFL